MQNSSSSMNDEKKGDYDGINESFQTSLAFEEGDEKVDMKVDPQAPSYLSQLKHTPPSFYDDLDEHFDRKHQRARFHSPKPTASSDDLSYRQAVIENKGSATGKFYGGISGAGPGGPRHNASLPSTPGQTSNRYGNVAGSHAQRVAEGKTQVAGDPGKNSNSTSSVFASSTINNPDADQIILCMAAVLQIQMAHDLEVPHSQREPFAYFECEGEGPGWGPEEQARLEPPPDPSKKGTPEEDLPSIDEIYMFINSIFVRARFSPECNIIGLVYINRVIANASIPLHRANWRPLILAALILAQKIWDDKCLATSNFALICPKYSKKQVKFFEVKFLELLQYQATVTQSLYAKYYFELRELFEQLMVEKKEEVRPFPLEPLPLWRAKQLEIYSDSFRLQRNEPAQSSLRGGDRGTRHESKPHQSPIMSPAQTLEDVTYKSKGRYVQS